MREELAPFRRNIHETFAALTGKPVKTGSYNMTKDIMTRRVVEFGWIRPRTSGSCTFFDHIYFRGVCTEVKAIETYIGNKMEEAEVLIHSLSRKGQILCLHREITENIPPLRGQFNVPDFCLLLY